MQLNSIIKKYLNSENLDNPEQLSKDLVELSAGLYTIGRAIIESDIAYAKVWETERHKHKSDKSCEMAMMTLKVYEDKESNKAARGAVIEIIRSVKKRLAHLSQELGEGNY